MSKNSTESIGAADQLVIDNVRKTLATTASVLEHFEQSLHRAGFAAGLASYRKMAETVLGQRIWSATRQVRLDAEFAEVARRARAIHEVLAPYADAMLKLGAVEQLRSSAPAQPATAEATDSTRHAARAPAANQPTGDDAGALQTRVLELLAKARRPMSATALCTETGCSRPLVLAQLAALERAGRIGRSAGARPLFRLADGPDADRA